MSYEMDHYDDDNDDADDNDNDDAEIKYYLYEYNLNRDIENNIGEVKAPEFTMEDIIIIDEKYKRCYEKIIKNANKYEDTVDDLTNILDINETYMEHRSNIERLIIMMNEYNAMYTSVTLNKKLTFYEKTNEYMVVRSKQIHMYFHEIEPILKGVKENLFEVLEVIREFH
tara:strand:+ start:2727 stop:3236 length:510 start_codon:yes stop_codon:yes gene_type:complete